MSGYVLCLLSFACTDITKLNVVESLDHFNECQEALLSYMQLSIASSLNITVERTMFTPRRGESYNMQGAGGPKQMPLCD